MKVCKNCQFYRDFSTISMPEFGNRCLNTLNSSTEGDFKVVSENNSCERFKEVSNEPQLDWDDKKNKQNQKKHSLNFEFAYEILKDPYQLQMVSNVDKWEKLDHLDFDVLGIEKNAGNLDPIRGIIIGKVKEKYFVIVYTHRDQVGDMKLRIISLRPANQKEIKTYLYAKNRV